MVPPDGPARRIGLCLSGGGFRAAFFGLGVVRYLAEAGKLGEVQAVSAVSGGSIAATVLANRWPTLARDGFSEGSFESAVLAPMVDTVADKNLRNRGLIRWAATRALPGGRYGSARGRTLVKHLVKAQRVRELPAELQVVLTSTDLASGRAFRVSQEFMGSWDFGYSETPDDLGLSTVLAASTAIPLIFPPVHLRTEGLGLSNAPAELSLMDGGVYDNLGLEWFQGWDRGRPAAARPCDFIVVVDASGPLGTVPGRFDWRRSLGRSRAIQYSQSRMSRIRWFVDQLLDKRMEGLYIPIDKDPGKFQPPRDAGADLRLADGALPAGFAADLSQVRTDLDRFDRIESELLAYHGYWSTHVRLHHVRPELAVEIPAWRRYADLSHEHINRLRETVREGAKRRVARPAPSGSGPQVFGDGEPGI